MCGIVGRVGALRSDATDPVGAALRALRSRGPDGQGRVDSRLGLHPLTLGVRRLDLVETEGPAQPVVRPDGGLLVLNGEIYNHRALRRELADAGETFRTGADAEVLAALLAREGVPGLARVRGSYAFAWLRDTRGPLMLGRDPLGVRPLSVALLSDGIVFGSTLDAILATRDLPPRPDLQAIADVLRDGVIPSCRTAIRGIRRIAPGEVLSIGADLRVRSHAVPAAADEPLADGEPDVLGALESAVRDRLTGPRPAALFLSGGVDSALIAALSRDHGQLPALTLTFPGHGGVDEARRAQRTARRLGLLHVEVPCPRDPTPWVLATADAFDEPFADASAVPTWGLALTAGRRGRIALTGTGGDEVFGGYRRYWLLGTGPWLRHVPGFVREPVSEVLERTLPSGARLLRASADPQGLYRGLLRLGPVSEIQALLGPRLAQAVGPPGDAVPVHCAEEAMADDLLRYLPDDLLVKEDRALMAHGVEGRHPFLDRRVRATARAIEIRGGVGRGRQKQVLRAFVQDAIDPDLARAPKRGFAFPVDDLYRGALKPLAEELLLSRRLRERGFLAASGVLHVLRDHVSGRRNLGPVLHAIVMLELWARRVLDGARVG